MDTYVGIAARQWAEQLVDLSGRNNLLFYRQLKVGTLDLADAAPDAFMELLRGDTVGSGELSSTPDDATRRLRAIAKTAQTNYEEKGLRTPHLALGLATWTNTGPTVPAAPLLLATVSIAARGSSGSEWNVTVDGDWVLNPTLLFKLRSEFGVTAELPEDLDPDGDGFDPGDAAALFEELRAALGGVPGFAISDAAFIGNFSYNRQPMVDDLTRAVDELAAHPLIRALAGDGAASKEVLDRHADVALSEPDRIEPRREFLVLDADASQNQVINAVISGADLVVQGPPGTGKSQTIANLIATLVSYRKSVLFVAQKRAAIDAVTKRLDGVGLGGLVMDLHDGTGSRKRIAAQLAEALAAVGSTPAVERADADAHLVAQRERLNDHSRALNEKREPWGVTVFDLQARLLGTNTSVGQDVHLSPAALDALPLNLLEALCEELAEWVNIGGPGLVDPAMNPWAGAYGRLQTQEEAQKVLHSINVLHSQDLPAASEEMRKLLAELGLREPATVEQWDALFSLLDEVTAVLARISPDAWTEDLDTLHAALEPADSFGSKLVASVFRPKFRAAKRAAAKLSTGSRRDASTLRRTIGEAISLRDRWSTQSLDGQPPRTGSGNTETRNGYQRLRQELAALGAWVGTLENTKLDEASARVAQLAASRDQLLRMPRAGELEEGLTTAGIGPVIATVRRDRLDAARAEELLRVVWHRNVLERIAATDRNIGAFSAEEQNRRQEGFVRADRTQIGAGRERVRRAWAEWVHEVGKDYPDQEQLIWREAKKKSRHKGLRDLFTEAPQLLQALRPCWTMSPLVVSQLLPATAGIFDVVVFDEASQVLPAEAIPALLRGSRAVVAGDSKQLPPTTFFDQTTDVEDLDEDVGPVTADMESILDAMSALLPTPKGTRTLTWHYRSQDERLIAFSNVQASLYRGSMVTFPGVVQDAVAHELVTAPATVGNEESVAEEVRRVIELIVEHSRRHPRESLGVIALGMKHADRIDMALRTRRSEDPAFDTWMARATEALFVKNLERVQGDERDAIILSLGFGKTANGTLRHHFGPINQAGGERRLNVAVTRARRRITLVSSFSSADLDPTKLNSEGPQMLRRYLEYAESGGGRLNTAGTLDVPLNPFESDMFERLQAAGMPVVPQYGVSGYRIDFAVAHPAQPGRMVLAVEADGASYHMAPTARDRDRLRQEHLERLGWRFCRVWSTNWFRNRDAEVARVRQAWIDACAASDATNETPPGRDILSEPSARPVDAEPSSLAFQGARTARSGPCPVVKTGGPITDYGPQQLTELIRWINSDTLLRGDDEVIAEAMSILGFRRRGQRIVDALQAAIRDAARA